MYLQVSKEMILRKDNIIGIFSLESIEDTDEYADIIKNLKEKDHFKNLSNGEEKTLILYKKDNELYGVISNISSGSLEKRNNNN